MITMSLFSLCYFSKHINQNSQQIFLYFLLVNRQFISPDLLSTYLSIYTLIKELKVQMMNTPTGLPEPMLLEVDGHLLTISEPTPNKVQPSLN